MLLLNYPSTPLTPGYTQSYVNNVFFGPAPSVCDYWREVSYGSTFASGDVFGPFTLDADYTCAQPNEILQAAIQAADSTVDFTAYQRIFLIFPVVMSTYCGWDGLAQMGCSAQSSPSKGNFTASVSWIDSVSIGPNIFGAIGGLMSTAIHEGGHNFGLRHASSMDYDTLPVGPIGLAGVHAEYGDPFSQMGFNPGHFAAPHKNMLGWLSPGTGWQEVESGGTWTIAPLSSQTSDAPHALRIQRGTGNQQWLWIEYRQPIGSYEPTILDNGAPRDFGGAIIHIEDPTQPSWAGYTELLDFRPLRLPNDFNNAMMKAGTTWSDPYSNLTLTVGEATSTGLTVTVSYDNGCATLSPVAQSDGPSWNGPNQRDRASHLFLDGRVRRRMDHLYRRPVRHRLGHRQLRRGDKFNLLAPLVVHHSFAPDIYHYPGRSNAGRIRLSDARQWSGSNPDLYLRVQRSDSTEQHHLGRSPDQLHAGWQPRLLHSLGCRRQLPLPAGRCRRRLAWPGRGWRECHPGE